MSCFQKNLMRGGFPPRTTFSEKKFFLPKNALPYAGKACICKGLRVSKKNVDGGAVLCYDGISERGNEKKQV